jgi:hypothetical protein
MKPARILVVLSLAALLAAPAARAGSSDGVSTEALSAAIAALRGATPGTPGAPRLDPRLGSIESSPELAQEFTDLAAAIFADLAARYDGDPQKMADVLATARTEPEAFARSLRPGTRARLEALSRKLENGR